MLVTDEHISFSTSGKHTIFGRVKKGMGIVEKISMVQVNSVDK